jgi:hypothetical protein
MLPLHAVRLVERRVDAFARPSCHPRSEGGQLGEQYADVVVPGGEQRHAAAFDTARTTLDQRVLKVESVFAECGVRPH